MRKGLKAQSAKTITGDGTTTTTTTFSNKSSAFSSSSDMIVHPKQIHCIEREGDADSISNTFTGAANNNNNNHHHNHGKRDRAKNTCTVSARMRQVVEQMLSCDPEQYAIAMQQTTIFAFKSQQSELVLSFLQEMRRENGGLYQNKEALLQILSEAYDKTQALFAV